MGITLFAGSEEAVYYRMPDLKDVDVDGLTKELEERGIRYRLTYERGGALPGVQMVRTSIPAGRLFKSSEEVEIKVISGGRYE